MPNYDTLVLHFTGEVSLDTDTLRDWKLSIYDPAGAYPAFVRFRGPTFDEIRTLLVSSASGGAIALAPSGDLQEVWKRAYQAAGEIANDDAAELRRLLDRASSQSRSGQAKLVVVADGVGARTLAAAMRYYNSTPARPLMKRALLRLPLCSQSDAHSILTSMPELCASLTVIALPEGSVDSFAPPAVPSWRDFVAAAIDSTDEGDQLANFPVLIDRTPPYLRARCSLEAPQMLGRLSDSAIVRALRNGRTLRRAFSQ